MPDTITIGGITCPVYDCPPEWRHLVPEQEDYEPQANEETALAFAYKAHRPIAFTGPAGSGKDTLIRSFLHRVNRPHFLLSMAEGTGIDQLIGSVVPVPKGNGFTVEFRYGALPLAIKSGGVLDLSEMNAADPRALMRLHDFLATGEKLTIYEDPANEGKYLSPKDANGEHNGYLTVVTMNPSDSGQYNGTQALNAATDDRFLHVELDYLGMVNPDKEAELIARKSGIRISKAKRIVNVFNTIRKRSRMADSEIASKDSQPMYVVASTRRAIDVALASKDMPIMRAWEIGFVTGINQDDRPIVHKLALDEFASDGGND